MRGRGRLDILAFKCDWGIPDVGMTREHLSRTMRIDLIPQAPSEPVPGKRKRVVIAGRTGEAEAYPEASEARESAYQRLLQSIYDAALIADLDGRIVDANIRAVEFLQYERPDLCSLTVFDLISGSDTSLIETLSQNLEDERFTLIQAYCLRKDGTMFPSEIAVNRLQLQDGIHLCFFVRDITLRRQAEEMLRMEHSAIQNAGNGIAVVDVDLQLEYANPSSATMWGYGSSEDMVGQDVHALFSDPSVAEEMVAAVTGTDHWWQGETTAKRVDGDRFDVQVSAVANRNSEGEIDGIVLSLLDISDRKRALEAEKELERRRVMLESLGAACHHLGQPATILLGNLGIIRKKTGGIGEDVGDLIDASIAAAKDLGKILHRLNAVNEYRTTQYLSKGPGEGAEDHRILDIETGAESESG